MGMTVESECPMCGSKGTMKLITESVGPFENRYGTTLTCPGCLTILSIRVLTQTPAQQATLASAVSTVPPQAPMQKIPLPDPPDPVYEKVLVFGKKTYRVGTCGRCNREKTPLLDYQGTACSLENVCLTCGNDVLKEVSQAHSQLVAAKAGGRYEERKPISKEDLYRTVAKLIGVSPIKVP